MLLFPQGAFAHYTPSNTPETPRKYSNKFKMTKTKQNKTKHKQTNKLTNKQTNKKANTPTSVTYGFSNFSICYLTITQLYSSHNHAGRFNSATVILKAVVQECVDCILNNQMVR